jgi:hypothetical protein
MSAPMFCRSGVAGQLSAVIHSVGALLLDYIVTHAAAETTDTTPVERSARSLRHFLQHAQEQIAIRRHDEPGFELGDSAQVAIDDATDYVELLDRFAVPCTDVVTWRDELKSTAASMVLRDHAQRVAFNCEFPAIRRSAPAKSRKTWPLWAQRGGWIGYLVAMLCAQAHLTDVLLRSCQFGWTVVLTLFALGTYASWVGAFRSISKPGTPTKEFKA